MMNITFTPLLSSHFPLLLHWLYAPHVRAWWDTDVPWTEERIQQKYIPYTQGYKILGDIKKPMHAFVIQVDNVPVGYIQYYNKYNFPPEQGYSVEGLPESLAAIDFYIGESDYLGKGLGSQALKKFLKEHVSKNFRHCFVDPDTANVTAIRTYQKAGFRILEEKLQVTWMVTTL